MQTSSSASSWRDFWKWVTLLPFCISSSACAVLERLSNMEHTSCCLIKKNMVNIVVQCHPSFLILWYIRLEILTYSQPGQHLCYELWPCQDPCLPSRSWPSISVVCKVIIFKDFIMNISPKSSECSKGLNDSTNSPVQEIFGSVGVPHMIAETVWQLEVLVAKY